MISKALQTKIEQLLPHQKAELEKLIDAMLSGAQPEKKTRGGLGSMKGKIWMADDFDAPILEQTKEAVEGISSSQKSESS